jgi:hypothetical protein
MILHVLPGDAYIDPFRGAGLEGDLSIFREALVEGDLWGPSLQEFWKTREAFHSTQQNGDQPPYQEYVAGEVEKLLQLGAGDEINLWFEYELFCSVNYWFCLYLLRDSFATIWRVAPSVRTVEERWKGFGQLGSAEFMKCWNDRVLVTSEDVELGSELWGAFRTSNWFRLTKLGESSSPAFPYLNEVSTAAAEIDTRPKQIVTELSSAEESDFSALFTEFGRRAGVYGFGDSQVKRLLQESRNTR